MNIVEFIESLSDEITHPEISIKKNALNKLSKYLSNLSIYTTNSDSVNSLVDFYVNILHFHYDLLPTIVEGLLIIIDFINFSNDNAKQITMSIVNLDVPQLQPTTRQKIYELLYQLFTFHLEALKTLDDNFLRRFICAIDGENFPACVFLVLKLLYIIVTNLNIEHVYQDYFESIYTYFPIEFKANKNTSSTLTRAQLVEITKKCMLGSPKFGLQLLPGLLEKICSDRKFARIDSLDILVDGVDRMEFSDVLSYHMSFIDCLLHEFRNRDQECSQLALRALQAMVRVFEEKANEKEMLELCWYLFGALQSIAVDSDTKDMPFLQAAITGGNGRVWSGLLAHFIPTIVNQLSSDVLKDQKKLSILCEILAPGNGAWARYPGLVNCDKTRPFFERLKLVFDRAVSIDSVDTDDKQLAALFSLLGYFSLFEVTFSSGDNVSMVELRCQLVRVSLSWILVNPNGQHLEQAVASLVPLLWRASNGSGQSENNAFINMLFGYCRGSSNLSSLAYKLLATVPVESLSEVLGFLSTELNDDGHMDLAVDCLSSITDRLHTDRGCVDELCRLIMLVLPNLIATHMALSHNAIIHVASVLSRLGDTSDIDMASSILDKLLDAVRMFGPLEPCNIWLCASLSHWPLTIIEKSIDISALMNLIFMMLVVVRDSREVRSAMCQTYGALLNRLTGTEALATFSVDYEQHLSQMETDIEFLLWNLKSALLASNHERVGLLMSMLLRPSNLRSALVDGISILDWPATTGLIPWVDENKQFQYQSVLYHQQSFHLVAQPFRDLADSSATGSDVAKEIYLKMIAHYPKQIIDLSIEEIVETVIRWFSKLTTKPDKLALRLDALRAICTLPTSNNSLSEHSGDIAESIKAICELPATSLNPHDRLFVALLIGWYVTTFPDYEAFKYRACFTKCLKALLADKKRVVRIQAARSSMNLL